jgi:hypothetical protein
MADPQLTSSTISQTTIPDYAKPYVEEMLGNAQSITDPNVDYQQYMGDRVAQFTPLQNQAFGNAALMQTAPQLQDASAMAGTAGLGALNTGYTYNPYSAQSFTSPGTAQKYMNPYLGVMDQAARRNADIAQQQQQAQAAQRGAFGGSGDYLMRNQGNAELQRNLGQNQYNAYNAGQQQFNTEQGQNQAAANLNAQQGQFGAGLGLQGLQAANQSAATLAGIGQQQYGQNMGINAQQAQYGNLQQQQVQNQLNNQYQDFLNYQNNPYKQISFMSDILRGLPMAQSTGNVYQTPPSMMSQAAGLGVAGLGLSKLGVFAEGGQVGRSAGLAELAIHNMG